MAAGTKERTVVPSKGLRHWFKEFWKQRQLEAFALLGMVFIIIFNYIPMVGIVMSFEEYNIATGFRGLFTSKWVGLKYFREFLNDYNTWPIIRNTLVLSLVKMVFTFPLPILLALALNEIHNMRFRPAADCGRKASAGLRTGQNARA